MVLLMLVKILNSGAQRMSRGQSNQEIAAELVLSAAAGAKHVSNIFLKLRLDPSEDNRRVKARARRQSPY